MSMPEFLAWCEFYRQFPFDDMHRYHRPAALVAKSLSGGDMDALLDWLEPQPGSGDYGVGDMNTFKAFGFKPPTKV